MVINLHSDSRRFRKSRDDEHSSEFQSRGCYFFTQASQVVPVSLLNSFDQPVHPETFNKPGDLVAGFSKQNSAKGTVLKSPDVELSPNNAFEQFQIIAVEKIKSAITPLTIQRWLGDLLEIFDAHGRIFDSRDEFEVTLVGSFQQFPKNREAIDGFLHRGLLHFPSTVPVFHPSVVLEKTDIVDGRLDAQDHRQFVIHLNGDGSHVVLDSSPFDTGMKVISYLSLISTTELTSQKRGYLLGLHGVDCRPGHGFVEGTQIALRPKDHIRGKLYLHQRPMVTRWEMPDHGTEGFCDLIQPTMELFHIEPIGELLCFREVSELNKGVLHEAIGDVPLGERGSQLVVSIEVELQPKGSPGRHPQIAQPQIFEDEVKVVVDTFGFRTSEKGPAGLLIVPGFKRGAGLQGREDVDQPRMLSALGDDLLYLFFLTEVLFPNELDLQPILLGQTLSMKTDFVPQGFGKLGVIENTDAFGSQMATHGVAVANLGNGSRDHHAVEAGKDTSDLAGVFFCQQGHGFPLPEGWPMFIDEWHKKVNLVHRV